MEDPAGGLSLMLGTLSEALNAHATGYAEANGLALDPAVPPFVALAFDHRTALLSHLLAPDNPEKEMWVGLALFSNMAYDSAAHMNTPDALAAGHPGCWRWASPSPTTTGCGGSPSSPTGARWRDAPAHHRHGSPA